MLVKELLPLPKNKNMKHLFLGFALLSSVAASAQIKTPQPSSAATFEETVGLTTVKVEYSRPSARGRKVFTDVVPFDEIWRTGANKNTIITTSDALVFGKDTLKAGTYAIFTKPSRTDWELYFYTSTENWGTPEKWESEKVALTVKAQALAAAIPVETFTLAVNDITITGATLNLSWGTMVVNFPFTVLTDAAVEKSIAQVMSGPGAGDYYRAADYYLAAGKDPKKALEWINKSVELMGDAPFYVLRKKSQIQAENKDYKGAIATAKLSLEKSKAAGNNDYVKMNEASIAEWSKK